MSEADLKLVKLIMLENIFTLICTVVIVCGLYAMSDSLHSLWGLLLLLNIGVFKFKDSERKAGDVGKSFKSEQPELTGVWRFMAENKLAYRVNGKDGSDCYVSIENGYIKSSGSLGHLNAAGYGSNLKDSGRDLAQKISSQILLISPIGEKRREIQVPDLFSAKKVA